MGAGYAAKCRQPSKQHVNHRPAPKSDHVASVIAASHGRCSPTIEWARNYYRVTAYRMDAALLLGVYFRHGLTAAQFSVVFR